MTRSIAYLIAVLACASLLAGCLERTITITSDPTGALVHLNDAEVGRTPVTVPFTFYGNYTVRLEHPGVWLPESQAAMAYDMTGEELEEAINTGKVQFRQGEAGREVRVDYAPLLTEQRAKAPIYEYPGLDLFAEAVPGRNTVNLDWHFQMERQPIVSEADLIERANEIRQRLDQAVDGQQSQSVEEVDQP
jgi:hypothetical protein